MAVREMRGRTVQLGPEGTLAGQMCVCPLPCPAEHRGGMDMTLAELSLEYRAHAHALDLRICQLEYLMEQSSDPDRRCQLQDRIRMLSTMLREARELAVLTERYYDRGYRRNAKYTI